MWGMSGLYITWHSLLHWKGWCMKRRWSTLTKLCQWINVWWDKCWLFILPLTSIFSFLPSFLLSFLPFFLLSFASSSTSFPNHFLFLLIYFILILFLHFSMFSYLFFYWAYRCKRSLYLIVIKLYINIYQEIKIQSEQTIES